MAELAFDCIDVRADTFAASPTMVFRLRVAETTGERVHSIALRCQFRLEPNKRRYTTTEAQHLDDLFGDSSRWADTMRAMQFAQVAVMVPSFTGSIEVDVPVECTYDLDIATARYFHGLEDGVAPVIVLFSGTMFLRGETGFTVAPVPWHKEASAAVPVAEWRRMMDAYFPDSGWLRLSRSTLDALGDYKSRHGHVTWEHAVRGLLERHLLERELSTAQPIEAGDG